jgi:hypothetical protein
LLVKRLLRIFILGLTSSVALLTACSPGHDSETQSSKAILPKGDMKVVSADIPHFSAPADFWVPQKVNLTCKLKNCLPQIGALLFVTPGTGGQVTIARCTAFLIDGDKIMSNGHCDQFGSGDGYFVTRTDIPQKAIHRITNRLFKNYTPNPVDSALLSGHPDVAIFQLDSVVADIQPLHLARGTPRLYATLTAYVVDAIPGADNLTMQIGQLNCIIHKNEAEFPFALSEAPDVITAYNCQAEHGNSGSPLFAENSWDVEAILEGSKDLPDITKATRAQQNRGLFPYEAHPSIEASNMRCLNYPSQSPNSCVVADQDETNKRFSALVNSTINGLSKRAVPSPQNYSTEFKTLPFEIKSALPSPLMEVEAFYQPTCTIKPIVGNLVFPSQLLKVDYDEWAEPKISVLQTEQSTGAVTQHFSNGVGLRMNWAPPYGPYEIPQEDPRQQLGTSFSIALPACGS